jgi:hypothetical protein
LETITIYVVAVSVEIVLVMTGIDRNLEQNAVALAAVAAPALLLGWKHRRRLSWLQVAFFKRLESDRSSIGDEKAGSASKIKWENLAIEGIVRI